MRPKPARNLVSLTEAAAYADVTTRTLRRWIASDYVPAYRLGPRLLKVDLAEVEAMLRPLPTAGRAS